MPILLYITSIIAWFITSLKTLILLSNLRIHIEHLIPPSIPRQRTNRSPPLPPINVNPSNPTLSPCTRGERVSNQARVR